MENNKDSGIASVAHIFSGVSSGGTINLQHKSGDGSTSITTLGANLIAIPLTTSDGLHDLNHGLATSLSGSTSGTDTYGTVGSTSVTLERGSKNGMYIAASFNSQPGSGATSETGTWQLQYSSDGSTWTDTGSPISRSMTDSSDTGAVTMYALADNLSAATYQVRLVSKSAGGQTIDTLNGTVAAVALSYDDANGDGYFEGFSTTSSALNNVADDPNYTGIQETITLDNSANGEDLFVSLNFSTTGPATAQDIDFDLYLSDGAGTTDVNQENIRSFTDGNDKGSGGSVALFSDLADGDYTIYGRYNAGPKTLGTTSATMVGFSPEAVPEPAAVTFIIWGGLTMLIGRRFMHR